MKRAVIFLSGGLDSATTLAIANQMEFDCHALTFDYGQRHDVELRAASRVAAAMGVQDHRICKIDLRLFGGSSLTSDALEVEKDRRIDHKVIPSTYVPARNTIMLSFGLAFAEVIGAHDIFYGANAVDYSGYPDCRPEYIEAFERMANLATKAGVHGQQFHIRAPLLYLSKAEIIRKGTQLRVDYSLTHSCYDPIGDLACGHCDSCALRRQGFAQAGVVDPTRYA